eukprot:TRINITY_DN1015_c0_g1_i2.p1 TRINITY_DN1015_c0_g1~~TRINITY_DN1015_c0_g1_i2.p1  ORF type:complete len:510 (-),score=183.10 TRINITY_DN1015_c0_g1_i2:187-1695(-)
MSLSELFEKLAEGGDTIPVSKVRDLLEDAGLMESIVKEALKVMDPDRSKTVTAEEFVAVKEMDTSIVENALRGNLVIPKWDEFCKDMDELFEEVEKNTGGLPAQYIPQLARQDPNWFGVCVQTVDGQLYERGDVDMRFTVQSCSKPITYAVAETLYGIDHVKKHVGHEPSGEAFNAFVLDKNNLPHNPMINAGAMMAASLVRPELEPADRFDYIIGIWKRLAGGCHIGFDNATFLSEQRTADRNFALGYFMKNAGAFDTNVKTSADLQLNLDYYFSCCSILATCRNMASVAATLANGGVNPVTLDLIFSQETVRNTLSLMFSCGMYDYSGEFMYSIGIPAKSGVAGCVIGVVPNVMGVSVWSPPLDAQGNSVRGVDFFTRLTQRYSFHVFDPHQENPEKKWPVQSRSKAEHVANVSAMCAAAAGNDVGLLRRLYLAGVPVNIEDYDHRTPMHLAASEGKVEALEWLLSMDADHAVKDRRGNTPLDDARDAKHDAVVAILEKL